MRETAGDRQVTGAGDEQAAVHALRPDGGLLCGPRDRDAARALEARLARSGTLEVTCPLCRRRRRLRRGETLLVCVRGRELVGGRVHARTPGVWGLVRDALALPACASSDAPPAPFLVVVSDDGREHVVPAWDCVRAPDVC